MKLNSLCLILFSSCLLILIQGRKDSPDYYLPSIEEEEQDNVLIKKDDNSSLNFLSSSTSCQNNGCKYIKGNDCQCNKACVKKNDCCFDYKKICQQPSKVTKPIFVECFQAPSSFQRQDRRSSFKELKIGTFNVNFLFQKGISKLSCPGSDCEWKNATHARQHIESIAQIIHESNVDILQLTEVEDCDALKTLNEDLINLGDDSYRPYLIRGKDTFTGQNVALLTRVDISEDMFYSNERSNYPLPESSCGDFDKSGSNGVSKHFFTRFHIKGLDNPISMIGLHFLAQPLNVERCHKREAQAQVIASMVNQAIERGDDVVVLGDFNDFDGDVPDVNNNQPSSRTIQIISQAHQDENEHLINVAALVNQEERYTQWWDKDQQCNYQPPMDVSSLDHILISPQLFRKVQPNGNGVIMGNQLFLQQCGTIYSDHFPIFVTIKTARERTK